MNLNLLRPFLAVADTRSFVAAAKRLGVERTSVSRAVAELERSLSVQLFHRTTRSVALTEAGTALYANVAAPLASVQSALGALPQRDQAPAGLLRVTAPTDVGAMIVAPMLESFCLRYPEVRLDLVLTNQRMNLVGEGFDVALRIGGRLQDSAMRSRRLAPVVMHYYAAPAYLARQPALRSREDLRDHRVLWLTEVGREVLGLGKQWSPALLANDVMMLLHACRRGLGVALLPSFLVGDDLASGHLVRVLPKHPVAVGSLYFLQPATQHPAPKVTVFHNALSEFVARSGWL